MDTSVKYWVITNAYLLNIEINCPQKMWFKKINSKLVIELNLMIKRCWHREKSLDSFDLKTAFHLPILSKQHQTYRSHKPNKKQINRHFKMHDLNFTKFYFLMPTVSVRCPDVRHLYTMGTSRNWKGSERNLICASLLSTKGLWTSRLASLLKKKLLLLLLFLRQWLGPVAIHSIRA